jgi:hypothetical protein
VTQLIAAVRRVGRDVPGAAVLITSTCSYDYARPGKPAIAWDDPAARDDLVSQLVNDALALLAGLDVDTIAAAGGKPAEAVALLALVAGQDVEPADGSDGVDGRWRIARKVAEDRVISTVDPETRHTRKSRENRREGFKAHIVVEPDTGLTTAAGLTKVNGPQNSDATVGARLLDTDPTLPAPAQPATDPGVSEADRVEVLGDSAYGSGPMLAALHAAGRDAVIKPIPLRPAVEGGFTLDDFAYDADAGTLTCPNQVTRRLSAKRTATFGTICTGCPLRARCTTSPRGRKIALTEFEPLRRAHRQRATDPAVPNARWSNAASPG